MPTRKSRAPAAAFKLSKEAKNTQDSQTPDRPHVHARSRAGRPAANNEGLVEPTTAGGGLTRRPGPITMSQLRRRVEEQRLNQGENNAPSPTHDGHSQPVAPSLNATDDGSTNDAGEGSSKGGKKKKNNKNKGSTRKPKK